MVRFDEAVKTADVAEALSDVFGGDVPQVVTFGNESQVRITTKYRIDESGADEAVETALYEGLREITGENISKEEFLTKYRQSSETVGPAIASDIKRRAA